MICYGRGIAACCIVFAILCTAPAAAGAAQDALVTAPVTFRVTVPAETPPADDIYIAGDFQGWDPGAPDFRLGEIGELLHEITLDLEVGTAIEFKFTRGDWGSVEKGPNGEEIPNRTHQVAGEAVLDLTVASWADIVNGSTITGDVSLITVPGFLDGRRVWVYLPPQYHDEPERLYPVLYMFDGQNVFDEATSYAGEWQVDETCEMLIPAGLMAPIIVVAVANGEGSRIYEYTPWVDPGYGGGGGEEHLTAFIDILMPHIDASYRTLTDGASTGLAGSSLGGLMSLYALYAHPEAFGLVGALSPSLWWSDYELQSWAAGQIKPPAQAYMDMGTLEPGYFRDEDGNGVADAIDDLRAMRDVMLAQGFVLDEDLMVVEDEGGMHSEAYWAARFPVALQFLFPFPETAVTADGEAGLLSPLRVLPNSPNPFNPGTLLRYELGSPATVSLRIFDVSGRLMRTLLSAAPREAGLHGVAWDGRDDGGRPLPSGVYLYGVTAGEGRATGRMTLLQ